MASQSASSSGSIAKRALFAVGATPVPEAATLAMTIIGLGMVGIGLRRWRASQSASDRG